MGFRGRFAREGRLTVERLTQADSVFYRLSSISEVFSRFSTLISAFLKRQKLLGAEAHP